MYLSPLAWSLPFELDWHFELDWLWASLLVLIGACMWLLNLVSLPGNWAMVAMLTLYVWLGPDEGRMSVGIAAIVVAFLLAIAGEIVELIAGAMGAKRAGASRRSTLFALLGSTVGAIAGAIIGVPIPAVGSIIAAVLFGGMGACLGAVYGEWTDGKAWKDSWAVGHAAFWGRTFGLLGKLSIGFLIWLWLLIAVVM